MNTTLKIDIWLVLFYLIVFLPVAYFSILAAVWLVMNSSWRILLTPISWVCVFSCNISIQFSFKCLRAILTPNWIEIGKDGIHHHTLFSLHKTFVAWQDIDNFYIRAVRSNRTTSYFLFYILKQDPHPPAKYFWQREKNKAIPLTNMLRGGLCGVIAAIREHCPIKRLTSYMSPDDYLSRMSQHDYL
mgnify:FL=1